MSDEPTIFLTPAKWVTEHVLMGITGLKKGAIKSARENSWFEGKHYKHFSSTGEPAVNNQCMYNWKEIDLWIDKLPVSKPYEEIRAKREGRKS